MATNNYNKIFGVKRTIWNSESFYTQDDDVKEQYKRDIMEQYDIDDEEELTEEKLAQYWYEDNDFNYDCERDNLSKDIDGCIIALARRSSHYGAICGNGRTGARMMGDKLKDIMDFNGDSLNFWAEGYNVHGRTADHDGSWSMIFRVCKSEEEAERLVYGNYSNDQILARTKSLYPYIAKIYGWPYRGSKKAA